MKLCPKCQNTYSDDTLSFCLEDGAHLIASMSPTVASFDAKGSDDPNATLKGEPLPSSIPTEVFSARTARTEPIPKAAPTAQDSPHFSVPPDYAVSQPPRKQNTPLVVGLSVVATLILIALGGGAAWLFMRDDKPAATTSKSAVDDSTRDSSSKSNAVNNGKTTSEGNTTPASTPAPVDTSAVKSQVTDVLNGWASASRAHDLNKHMSYYATTLDTYYQASNVSSQRVRSDRSRAYNIYTTLDIELSDIKITPDPSGATASATFDKTWTFEGVAKYSSGSVHQKIWLTKIDGRWLITGEKDLKVYYVNNYRP